MTDATTNCDEYRADDWNQYKMEYKDPHRSLEPIEKEIAIVGEALESLKEAGIIERIGYNGDRFLAYRKFVAEQFEIPWTAISPRMQRVIWSINAIAKPKRMVAAGCFCGNTYMCNAGAAVGPGAVYEATELIGIEIDAERAAMAAGNVAKAEAPDVAKIVTADAVAWCEQDDQPIDLLYLDADGTNANGKGIYLTILQAALPRMKPGSLVLAHNSVNCAEQLSEYLAFVRDPQKMAASVNVIVDGEGLEVTKR